MEFFLGVDGGQSGTTALIGEEQGRIIGRGEGGPCNHASAADGRAKLERAVAESVGGACRAARLDAATVTFSAACFGMSGGPDDKEAILAGLLRTSRLLVTHDAATALAGATATGQGIVVIAGTGSIAFGRDSAGRTARSGGWGYVFGDEAGAFDIVRQAIRAALRMEEGWGPPTALRQELLEATAARSANQALHDFYSPAWPRSRVATLAPLVDAAAGNGDAVALQILDRAAQDLALLAAAVRGQLWAAGDAVELAYVGGVFKSGRLLERFRMLAEFEEGNRCHSPIHGPAEGALLEAYRSAGLNPDLISSSDRES
jgi:N-acetylglucosamine kinase-like BadF-type ATPase